MILQQFSIPCVAQNNKRLKHHYNLLKAIQKCLKEF